MTEFWSGWIDTHCHLASGEIPDLEQVLRRARGEGLSGFVMGGVDPVDWSRQLELAKTHPSFWPVFGVHPYYVSSHTLDECESALDQLARELPKTRSLIGEMGLDFRPRILGAETPEETKARQLLVFESQLEMAKVSHRAICLHVVRAADEAIRLLELHGVPERGGFVHAFNGSKPEAQEYLSFGLHLSVGGAVCRGDNKKLHQAVELIPLNRIMLESDSQDQPQLILQVAQVIAGLKKTTPDAILRASRDNLRGLLI